MTTIINTPREGGGDSSGAGLVIGIVIAILIVVLFFVYILPAIRANSANNQGTSGGTNINVQLPAPTGQQNSGKTNGGSAPNPAPSY